MTSTQFARKPEVTEAVFDVEACRLDFPALSQEVHGKPLVYLDSAATALTPTPVIDAISRYYREDCANVHRGVHLLSQRATERYEGARENVRKFIGAREAREIVFVRGATEGINLVARTFGALRIREGDEVVVSEMEHHSNIVPWQMLCDERGARLRVIAMNEAGEIRLDSLRDLLGKKTKLLALVHVSNALGTVNPAAEIVSMAHERNIPVLLDGAQAVSHLPVNVQELGCDFYVFSGHKLYGPTGIGVLYGRADLLQAMPPYQGGGDMIRSVTFERTDFNAIPYKFEAGTPNIAGAVGLGAAIDYLSAMDFQAIGCHEHRLVSRATDGLRQIPGIRIVGEASRKVSVVSFVVEGVHPHDIGTVLDMEGVAIRTGHHCAQPVMDAFGLPATARASFGLYNNDEEVDRFLEAVRKAKDLLG